MTAGQIYEKDKLYYDNLAKKYIEENLKNINDVCYVPFTMKTCYTRILTKKISDGNFIVFNGYVKDIENYDEHIKYNGNIENSREYTLNKLICYFGFEFSLNPYHRKQF